MFLQNSCRIIYFSDRFTWMIDSNICLTMELNVCTCLQLEIRSGIHTYLRTCLLQDLHVHHFKLFRSLLQHFALFLHWSSRCGVHELLKQSMKYSGRFSPWWSYTVESQKFVILHLALTCAFSSVVSLHNSYSRFSTQAAPVHKGQIAWFETRGIADASNVIVFTSVLQGSPPNFFLLPHKI